MSKSEFAEGFVNKLRRLSERDDRKLLAELRRGLSKTSYSAAWSALVAVGGRIDSAVDLTVAGLFALHPIEDSLPNLGATWRELRWRSHRSLPVFNGEDRTPFERRFNRLLACRTKEELCEHLRSFVMRAKSEGLGINYISLHADISRWDYADVRLEWAKEYWKVPAHDKTNPVEAG